MRLLQLVGSPVDDFHADLSRLYAGGCLRALGEHYEMSSAYVAPGGSWRFPATLHPSAVLRADDRDAALAGLVADLRVVAAVL